jgi:hypothetical protein
MIHLSASGLVVLAAMLAWTGPRKSTVPTATSRGDTAPVTPRTGRSTASPVESLPQLSPHAAGSAEHSKWVDARADALVKLSWMDDAGSLKQLVAELENPEPEIRKAALQAVANFGSRDAVPYLESLVSRRDDPQEKIDLIQTAEQLKMQTASEYFARKEAAATK